MLLSFRNAYVSKETIPSQPTCDACLLLKNYIMPGTSMCFGRDNTGAWFWEIDLPVTNCPIPSEVRTLLQPSQSSRHIFNREQENIFTVSGRIISKNPSLVFTKPITNRIDLCLEAIFSRIPSQFSVSIDLLPDPGGLSRGLHDAPFIVKILTNSKVAADFLAGAFDSVAAPFEKRNTEQFLYVGSSEIHYLFRIPIYTDRSSPHLIDTPADIPLHFEKNADALARHMLIAGLSGSGKTSTLKAILTGVLPTKQLQSLFIADVKGEYGEWSRLNNINYLEAGRYPDRIRSLNINPFIPGDCLRLSSHIDVLSVIFAIGNSNAGGVLLPSYFKLFLEEFYTALLYNLVDKHDWPGNPLSGKNNLLQLTGLELKKRLKNDLSCFEGLNHGIIQYWNSRKESYLKRVFGNAGRSNTRHEIEDVISSRLAFYETSVLQNFSYGKSASSIDSFLKERNCISLAGFSKSTMQLLLCFFSMMSFETLLAGEETRYLKHLMVFEEAHIIAGKSSPAEILTIEKIISDSTERMLSEGRSKGIGLILTDQMPGTRLANSIIANTSIKICHNLAGEDGAILAKAVNLPDASGLNCLGVGEAYVKIEDRLPGYKIKISI